MKAFLDGKAAKVKHTGTKHGSTKKEDKTPTQTKHDLMLSKGSSRS